MNAVTDYYFRGLTQTWGGPAIQGGFDVSHTSGLYAGFWASNVSGNQYAGGSLETDWYGGYNYKLGEDAHARRGADLLLVPRSKRATKAPAVH